MILLKRARTPDVIPKEFRDAGRIKNCSDLIRLIRGGKEPASSVWKKAKNRLKAESFGKCAYCESSTSTVAHGDVEHFRPKSEYWWLAYCFDNYTFSCQICNQSYKGSNFPRSGPGPVAPLFAEPFTDTDLANLAAALCPDPLDEVALSTHRLALAKEKAHLPDPYVDDPEPLFSWFADSVLKEVVVRPRTTTEESTQACAAVDRFLGLNRDELKRRRYEIFQVANTFAELVKLPNASPIVVGIATTQLKNLMDDSAEYAGMVRYFVKVEWKLTL